MTKYYKVTGEGKCPQCKRVYDNDINKARDKKGFPICPKCKVVLRAKKRKI